MADNMRLQMILEAVDKTDPEFRRVQGNLRETSTEASNLSRTVGLMSGAFAAMLLGKIATDVFSVSREFQSLNASLTTVTGSRAAADKAFAQIREFATETPYQLQEVTQAFIKLKALGLDPSQEALRSYGNTASSMGKSLDQMIEAVADAATGEFERLKEFGIRASKQGEQITFTFRGVETTVRNSSAEIETYLRRIGEVEFAGGMARQMETLDGKVSNFGDSWDSLMNALGEVGGAAAASHGIDMLTEAVNRLRRAIKPTVEEDLVDLRSELKNVTEQIGAMERTPGLAWAYGGFDRMRARQAELRKQIGDKEIGAGLVTDSWLLRDQGLATASKNDPGGSVKAPTKAETRAAAAAEKHRLAELAKAGGELGDDLWLVKDRERYEVKLRSTEAGIDLERQAAEEGIRLAQGVTDAWRLQEADKWEVKSRSLDALLELEAESFDVMTAFGQQAAANMQTAFADFLFDPFEDGLGGMLESFEATLRKMLAQIAANQILSAAFSGLAGSDNSFLASIGSSFSGAVKKHDGGMVVPRFHFGGLASDEVPAVLQTNERVLSREQSRLIERLAQNSGTSVQVINNGPGQARTERGRGPDGRELIKVVIEAVKGDMAGGGFDATLGSSFGLTRRGR